MVGFLYVVDNSGGNTVAEVLRKSIKKNSLCSIASAYFTVSGFDLIAYQLEACRGLRLLLGKEPGSDPLNMMITDIWKNIDVRDAVKQAKRAVEFFSRPEAAVRLHPGPFFHGKTYILNHPEPVFINPISEEKETLHRTKLDNTSSDKETGRPRPTPLLYTGRRVSKADGASAVVGSSNFTYGGLIHNSELNLFDPEGESLLELLTWFEERWQKSDDIKQDLIKALQGYYRPFAPFWIYAKALWELYKDELEPQEAGKPGSTIELADFQTAGYRAAKRVLSLWNAVLVADAPGLGKTYIAGKILEDYAYHQRQKALIICPAEVEGIWEDFRRKYNIPVARILHTEVLGRGMRSAAPREDPKEYQEYPFILVDESHHFRNPSTGRYLWMQQLLALPKPKVKVNGELRQVERTVLFVTATPVNNSVWDLYHQLTLLFGPRLQEISARQGIADVTEYFKNAEEGTDNVYDLIEAVAVRRSRAFIREYYPTATLEGKRVRFPERELKIMEYELHEHLADLHVQATNVIESSHLTPYRLESYRLALRDEIKILRGELLAALFRVLLLKRLESSLFAFRLSLQTMVRLFEMSLQMLNRGEVWPAETLREFLDALEESKEDESSFEAAPEGGVVNLSDFDVDRMKADLSNDIKALKKVLSLLPEDESRLVEMDQKFQRVKSEIYGAAKIIVFTSFVDTANYLFRHLKKRDVVVGLVTGEDSRIWDGNQEQSLDRDKIIKLFSPVSNEYALRSGEREIQILISTDVLSEAINLQDSPAVLNYDFPWNPMKLVQRAGRIDRIGSLHNTVVIYDLFPNRGLDTILGLMQRLMDKIAQAHRSVGLEWSLIGEAPLPLDFAVTLERVRRGDKRVLIDIEKKMEGLVGLDPQEQLIAILQTLSKEEIGRIPDGAGSLTSLPEGPKGRYTGLFVAYRKRRPDGSVDRIWRLYPDGKLSPLSNKTEIVEQIRFPKSHSPLDRFGEESLQRLRQARITEVLHFIKGSGNFML
jgi:SNF2 family DNA or RNA helicase